MYNISSHADALRARHAFPPHERLRGEGMRDEPAIGASASHCRKRTYAFDSTREK